VKGNGTWSRSRRTAAVAVLFGAVISGGAGLLGSGVAASKALASVPTGTPVFSNPLDIDNAYYPLEPGTLNLYGGIADRRKTVEIQEVTGSTRTFAFNGGTVECRVVRFTEFEDGDLAEISDDYFAQADDGTVYYFGEISSDYEDGEVSETEGWLVGGPTLPSDPPGAANAPVPAIWMPANPEVGDTWKPEDVPPLEDETARVLAVGQRLRTGIGRRSDVIKVRGTDNLEGGFEINYFAAGVGLVGGKEKGSRFTIIAHIIR